MQFQNLYGIHYAFSNYLANKTIQLQKAIPPTIPFYILLNAYVDREEAVEAPQTQRKEYVILKKVSPNVKHPVTHKLL